MSKLRVYFNQAQIDFVTAYQKIKTLVAGRGFGKSTVISLILLYILKEMPRCKVFFCSTTLEQIKNMTLPPVIAKLAEMGIHEGAHFVVGLDPWKNPKTSWFKHPISPPKKYDNVMTFWNGVTVVFLSAAKPNSQRGGSYDVGIVDEAAFVKRSMWEKVLLKMVRGNLYRFTSKMHHSLFVLTSQPRTSDGFWVMEMEEKSLTMPDDFKFTWASAKDNEVVLGKEWFRIQKATSSHLDYLIEVENKRMKALPNGFYHKFNPDLHTYVSNKNSGNGKRIDIDEDELLEMSFDFSGKFNCCTVYQEAGMVERMVAQHHMKDEGKILALVDAICKQYKSHKFKYVRLWGEPRGRNRNELGDTVFNQIQRRFMEQGWQAELMVKSGYASKQHKERFAFMELLMQEESNLLPKLRVNSETCKDALIAIQTCDINPDYTKNKKAEKDENFPQEHAPHYTDTMDYYLYEKHSWRLNSKNQEAGTIGFI